ncbi:RHS repeat-associated core domain-containing protein, partial [Cellulomonas persica]|uniref:RHS repeat-associated core domain-containing protein n=1 Tax=Cellulomonas persica TaxID=76861 RepID=UPI0011BEC3B1
LPDRQCFRYDGLRRLTEAFTVKDSSCPTSAVGQNLLGGASPYWTNYTYDDLGNRTSQTQHATTSSGADRTSTYTYGAGAAGPHALTSAEVKSGNAAVVRESYSYDKAGRQSKRQLAGAPQQTLTWDSEGELQTVTAGSSAASFVYDGNGDRLTRTDSSGTTVYLPGGQEILVTAADGVKSATRYYGFDGQTVAVRDKNGLGGVTSLVGDPHGTTLAAIPNTKWAANDVVKQYTDPFGAARGAAASIPGDRQFLDKTRDTATGLTMVGARYYDEANGRFISVDPVLDLADPQQWNAYAYANNNPTT